MSQTNQAPELRVEVRISEHPVSEAERSRRLRRLGERLERIRRRQIEEGLRGRLGPDRA